MSVLMRCNVCFQQPGRATSRFSITNCGHVMCEICQQKGRKGECGVCRSHCRTIPLSNETDPEVKMLFMDINVLCGKYTKEFAKVIEFQESHRRRFLAHAKVKISKLEDTVKELNMKVESIRSPPYKRQSPSGSFMNMGSESHSGFSYSLPSSQLNSRSCSVDTINLTQNAPKKNHIVSGPTRLSLISPPKDGHMGHGPHHSGMTGSLRPAMSISPSSSFHQLSQSVSPADHVSPSWEMTSQRFSNLFPPTPLSSRSSMGRQPIMLANILKRHR